MKSIREIESDEIESDEIEQLVRPSSTIAHNSSVPAENSEFFRFFVVNL